MKRLYICRHGKAEQNSLSGKDIERNLVLDGITKVKQNSKLVKVKGANPDLLISSNANRAFQTAIFYSAKFKLDINLEPKIYEASLKNLLQIVNNISNKHSEIMIFGHNPGFSMLASYLSGQNLGDLPTACCIAIEFENLNWDEISGGTGKLLFEIKT